MKIGSSFLTLLLISLSFFSCEKEKPGPEEDYLPLEIGNYWQLEHREKLEITGTTTIDGKEYYALVRTEDTSFYRIEDNKVYVIEYEDEVGMKFDLTAEEGDSWNYGMYEVILASTSDTLMIGNQMITDCYDFYFNIPVMVDDEHSITLAPGIGFVQQQCGECLYSTIQLEEARIGGELVSYE